MNKFIGLFFGIVATLVGLTIGAWVAYNLLIERLPATEGRNPLPAILFSGVCLSVGVARIRRFFDKADDF